MQETENDIGIVWFRNDLRVQDNTVLESAISNHKSVIACYCFDPRTFENTPFGFKKTGKYRAKFLIESVKDLRSNLKKLHIELFVFVDKPEIALQQLVTTHDCNHVYYQEEWTSEECTVLKRIKDTLPDSIHYHSYYDQFLFHPNDIGMTPSEIPKVFTQFRKTVESKFNVRPIQKIHVADKIKHLINTTPIPSLADLGFSEFETHPNTAFPFKGGETAAFERLNQYFFDSKKLGVYKKTRNGLIGTDYSSKLSAWLANGSISARTIYWKVRQFEQEHFKNDSTYWLIFELIWRDYFKYIALKHGTAIFQKEGILKKDYHWKTDSEAISKWMEGRTASEFVNANMLELKKTGWMSNRGRQNVASYFSKELLLDWRIGAAYFESLLIDYDVHSNYGNWMYVSGVGNDPRDRKFNVERQAERYDPNGNFQRLWLQETLF
ncbi:DASH family cryptochrome [Psychroserpens sp. BH13MA-6]